jgi:ABC-2 type transport system ATP-binding protein
MLLSAHTLTKRISKKIILENISFSINKSEIIGLIGSNGSGKTTLLNVLTGILEPSSGSVKISKDTVIGSSLSRKGLFSDMTVANNLKLQASLLGVGKFEIDQVLDKFQVDFADKLFGKLSSGMKQWVSLIVPWLRSNHLILLDEPTNHLDINSILLLRSLILQRKQEGCSFLITSHILSDLEKVCDRILFMKQGSLIGNFQKDELIANFGSLEDAYLSLVE